MTWTSDNTAICVYSVLATLLLLAWIYVPA
jgi:hypothetical protein